MFLQKQLTRFLLVEMLIRVQWIDSIETYAYGMSKYFIYKKEKPKLNNVIKQYWNVYLWLY